MPAAIGILGGTFDPPHAGHVAAAVAAHSQLGLDEVRVIPAGQAPLRSAAPVASAADRVAMCRLAFAGHPWAVIDDRETRRAGTSWSVDTARELAREHPDALRVWILGADQLARLDRWKDVVELCGLVEFATPASPPPIPVPVPSGGSSHDMRRLGCRLESGVSPSTLRSSLTALLREMSASGIDPNNERVLGEMEGV